jgi:hypothetical protein
MKIKQKHTTGPDDANSIIWAVVIVSCSCQPGSESAMVVVDCWVMWQDSDVARKSFH